MQVAVPTQPFIAEMQVMFDMSAVWMQDEKAMLCVMQAAQELLVHMLVVMQSMTAMYSVGQHVR